MSILLLKAQAIARAAQIAGGRALLVGGYVRDELLGLAPKDADLEVYGLQAPVLRALLEKQGRVDCVGESFRVYKVAWWHEKKRFELDVSLPRRDKKVGEGHKGFEVEGDPFASVQDAARRRDFTLNAILKDPLTGEILDPFNGKRDLDLKILRAVDITHFGEDSLRVLRAMQFAARFGLQVAPETAALCRSISLLDLPKERVWGEWEKLLMRSKRPSPGLRAAAELGVLAQLHRGLHEVWEKRGVVIGETADGAARERDDLPIPQGVALMLASLGTFLGQSATEEFLEQLNVFKIRDQNGATDVRTLVLKLVGARKTPSDWFRRRKSVEDKDFRFFSARVPPVLAVKLSRARGETDAAEWFEANLRRLGVLDGPPAPLLMGRHLLEMGFTPGPHIGKLTQDIYIRQLAGEISTLEEAKVAAQKQAGDLR